MNGEFHQSIRKYAFCLLFLLSGVFLAVRFALWGIAEVQAKNAASAVFCFAFAVLGFLFGCLALYLFQFNRKAFFRIEGGQIDAQFGCDQALCVPLSKITDAESRGKDLKLVIGTRIVWVYQLCNAKELCQYILSRIVRQVTPVNREDAERQYRKSKRSYRLYLTATILVGVWMLLHIGWCVLLTEGKDTADFSTSETYIFLAFALAETVTVSLTFWLASKAGKELAMLRLSHSHIVSAIATEHKRDGLEAYSHVFAKKYFDHCTYRIVIFSPKESVFAYMLERFDISTLSWLPCYPSAKGFATMTYLYEELEQAFEDVMLED